MVSTSALAANAGISGTSANNTTGTTTVKYAVTEGYTWSVPSEIDFSKDGGAESKTVNGTATNNEESKVSVSKNVITEGKKLKITAKGSGSNGAFTIKNITDAQNSTYGSEELTYTIKVGESQTALVADGEVLTVAAGTNTANAALAFTLTTTNKSAEVAGNYSGTVTYTASIVNQTTQAGN